MSGPYTTITVQEYAHLSTELLSLRKSLQAVRELLEGGKPQEALVLVRGASQ